MDPQKNAQAGQTNDPAAANWNDEQQATAGNPTGMPTDGASVPPTTPPAPAESTVGGPDAPNIASDLTPGQTPGAPGDIGVPPQPGVITPDAPQSGTPSDASDPLTGGMPPTGPTGGTDAAPSSAGPTPAEGHGVVPGEPGVHHPSSATFVLIGLAVLIVAALAIFVVPMLF